MERKKAHNIAASLILAVQRRKIAVEVSLAETGRMEPTEEITTLSYNAEKAAREAIEEVIVSGGYTKDAVLAFAKKGFAGIISARVPKDGTKQLTFAEGAVTHEQYAGEDAFTEYFKRVYASPTTGEVILEYSDHVTGDEVPADDLWHADILDEAFTLDELCEVAAAIERGEYVIEDFKGNPLDF